MFEAEIRMEIYVGLAVAFGRPHRQMFSFQMQKSLSNIFPRQAKRYLISVSQKHSLELFAFIEKNAKNNDEHFWQGLQIEYNRLFVGPYAPKANPHESIYRNQYRHRLNECALHLGEIYSQEGLSVRSHFHDLPDHIIAELEYMAVLCERELQARQDHNPEKTLQYLLKQYGFLVEHLGTWTSDFSKKIETGTDSLFYVSSGQVLKDFISDDVENLREAIFKHEAKALNSQVNAGDKGILTLPAYYKKNGNGVHHIAEINAQDCILCGTCVCACPPQALRIADDPRTIRLLFNVALCSGCEQCLAVCPQQALNLVAVDDQQKSGTDQQWLEIASSRPTKCAGCGSDYSPDKMQQQVLASFSEEKFSDAFFEMLSLCPNCKRGRLLKSNYRGIRQRTTLSQA